MTVDLNMMLDLRDLQVAMDVAKRAELGWFDVEFTMYGTCFIIRHVPNHCFSYHDGILCILNACMWCKIYQKWHV